MIRMVHLLTRRAGLGTDEFNAWWRDEHGPLVAAQQTRLGILRYTQLFRDPDSAEAERHARNNRGGMQPPFDGVAEYWFESDEALAAALASAAGRRADAELIADESQFLDTARSPLWFAHEYPQHSVQRERMVARPKTGIIKVHFPLAPLAGLSDAEAKLYWHTTHGPLIRSHSVARGSLCYQQVHRYDSPLAAGMRAARGAPLADYIGHAEAWFDRLASRSGAEADDAAAAALADERKFIDWSRSTFMIGKELVFVDRDWV